MIITSIKGGLGNQMFQYAAGRALADFHNCQLKLDLSWFELFNLHNGYELDKLQINAEIANYNEVIKLIGHQNKCSRIFRGLGLKKRAHYIETTFDYCNTFFYKRPPLYLDGYWQSFQYFEKIKNALHKEFMPAKHLSQETASIASKIEVVDSVSMHIRRGDYVANRSHNSIHGVIDIDYYHNAIKIMETIYKSPHFFIFSDDMNWVLNNLKIKNRVTYVGHNAGQKSYEDMQLMLKCKSNIIANSSFSWWGAWLNQNNHKTVIAPKMWFNNGKSAVDLLPRSWVLI